MGPNSQSSWLQSHNGLPGGSTSGLRNLLIRKHGADRFFEVVARGLRPLGAQVYVPVIDAPTVYLAQLSSLGNEDSGLRGDGHMRHPYQALAGVERSVCVDGKLGVVGAHCFGIIGWIEIN